MSELAGLKELITQRFDAMDERVDALTDQVRETNGRLRGAETAIADMRPRVGTLEREMGETRRGARSKREDGGENRRITKWDVTVFCAGLGVAYGLGVAFRWLIDSMRAAL